ncbi:MAG: Fur family transcriptional regulator, partial [Alphaproteobacteria bacterium]
TSKSARQLVFEVLQAESRPLSAYVILDRLKKQGVRSPPIVYRALEKLLADDSIHRVEQLNAYMACNQQHEHALSTITVCRDCKKTTELADESITRHLKQLKKMGVNITDHAVIELPVYCSGCGPH